MLQCINAWINAYYQQEFIRFAIVDKSMSKAIGTIEMFGYVGKYKNTTGILRVDIASEYENEDYLNELFSICNDQFFNLFQVDTIATKAIPLAIERRKTLFKMNYCEDKLNDFNHYFILTK